jgi:hypothetical protein
MTRMVYPDWKYKIEMYLGQKIHYDCNELLWHMHDMGLTPEEAFEELTFRANPLAKVVWIRSGYRGNIVRGVIVR